MEGPGLAELRGKKVLVTGGGGYIGSHAVWHFIERGLRVVVVDTMENANPEFISATAAPGLLGRELQPGELSVCQGSTGDQAFMRGVLQTHPDVFAVFNFAAYVEVGESVKDPLKYYANNTSTVVSLLQVLVAHGVKYFLQSSTAAVYGDLRSDTPIEEHAPTQPINAYGSSKLMAENIIADCGRAHGLKFVCFRYFNVCGAHRTGLIGENRRHETHLLPLVIKAAEGRIPAMTIFGEDYETRDGTCVRDYVDMEDLLAGHLAGLGYLLAGGHSRAINLGSSQGVSVKEVIQQVKTVTGKDFPVVVGPSREGDPKVLVASNTLAKTLLNWEPKKSLTASIAEVWKFTQHHAATAKQPHP